MPWYLWSDYIMKRACRYLLTHYIGHFLEEKLTLDQLSIDLYNGTGKIKELSLDVNSLNEALDHYGLPIEIVEGYISSIMVTIPWAKLNSESTLVEVENLELTLQPIQREENNDIGIEEMFSSMASMTSSIQLATEVLKDQHKEEHPRMTHDPQKEEVEKFAQTIDTVLSHVKVIFLNTTIRLEHLPRESDVGVALELRVDKIEYYDDIVNEGFSKGLWQPTFANKNICASGMILFVDEFHKNIRSYTQANSLPLQSTDHDCDTTKGNLPEGLVWSESLPFLQSDPIQVASFTGKQHLKIKIKQHDSVIGPKLELDCQLGMVNFLFTPRQVHVLMELLYGLTTPWTCDDTRLKSAKKRSSHSGNSSNFHSFSGSHFSPGAPDESELFFSTRPGSSRLSEISADHSLLSEYTLNSTQTDIKHGSSIGHRSHRPRDSKSTVHREAVRMKVIDEPSGDLTHYKVRVFFMSITLLHENFTSSPGDGLSPGETAIDKLKKLSKSFFEQTSTIESHSLRRNLKLMRNIFSDACSFDHLGCLCKPLALDCIQKMGQTGRGLSLDLSVGDFEFVESLFDRNYITTPSLGFSMSPKIRLPDYGEILVFKSRDIHNDDDGVNSSTVIKPSIKLKLDTVDLKKLKKHRNRPPKVDVFLELGVFECEVDITIIDRIHTLLHPDLMCCPESSAFFSLAQTPCPGGNSIFTSAFEDQSAYDTKFDLHLKGSACRVKLKFPVPVLGEYSDQQAWWKRSLRKEILIVDLSDYIFKTSFSGSDSPMELEFLCQEAHGLFQESDTSPPVSIAYLCHSGEQQPSGYNETFDYLRVVLKWTPNKVSPLENAADTDEPLTSDSLNGAFQFTKPDLSPFSSRKFLHEPNDLMQSKDMKHENEEMVLPGNREEMRNFQQTCMSNCKLSLELFLHRAVIRIHDKDFLEVLYNRINNDLLLWERCAPSPKQPSDLRYSGQSLQLDILPDLLHSNLNSLKHADSDVESDDSLDPLYSIHDKKFHRPKKSSVANSLSILLEIVSGELLIGTPYQGKDGVASKTHQGELLLKVENLKFFAVNDFCGNPNIKYLTLQSNGATVSHCGNICVVRNLPSLYRCPHVPTLHDLLKPCIYQSSPGLTANSHYCELNQTEAFSIAVKTSIDPANRIKEFLVSLSVSEATLRHYQCRTQETWISQMIEFLNVQDYPIQGYVEPRIITQLHIHLWNCAVDYRPLQLPLKTLITVENFSLSCNLVAKSPISLLRFIVNDGRLYLSDNIKSSAVHLRKDYVCVLDVEHFDLSLLTNENSNQKVPRVSLQALANRVNMRTCSDSARALFDLIQYYASDGDLELSSTVPSSAEVTDDDFDEEDVVDSSSFITARDGSDTTVDATSANRAVNGDSVAEANLQQNHTVDVLMDDAMREDRSPNNESQNSDDVPTNPIHYTSSSPIGECAAPQLDNIVDSIEPIEPCFESSSPRTTDDDDDGYDFCVIDEPGLGMACKDGKPNIRLFTDRPIKIVDEHFSISFDQPDELKAPEHFPPATIKYVLKDLTLHWFLYGGHDFEYYNSKRHRDEPFHSRKRVKPKLKQSAPNDNWLIQGGRDRNLDVLVEIQLCKVRMQHETYPDNSELVSRKVLIIKNVEICDRLVASSINKLLYQYTSDTRPKQTHANMILVKAITNRCPNSCSNECSLRVSMLPVRLNIDQDTLLYLHNFITEMTAEDVTGFHYSTCRSSRSVPDPVMCVADGIDTENLSPDLIKFDELSVSNTKVSDNDVSSVLQQPLFFKSFVFSPEVPIRLDYHGKGLDMHQGAVVGLLAGLAQLNCSELRLKRLEHKHGLLGFDKVFSFAINEWLKDVKTNQLPGILGGVGPMHSFVQLVQGVKDLFWLPIEQYQKDRRIVRGIQRGASSFTTCTAMAILELTNRVVQSVQYVAEVTYDVIAPGPPTSRQADNYQQLQHRIRRSVPPSDLREGFSNAYTVIAEGITGTAKNIASVATAEHERKGLTGAVGGVLRQIPPTIVQPIIIASSATSNILGGMRNQLKPEAKREDDEKWKDLTP